MRTWLFQANSKRFDIEGWLASRPAESEWLVSRYADKVQRGDRVFLWRSAGDGDDLAGVFAEAETVSDVRKITDDGPPEFWTDPTEAALLRPRVRIALRRVANKKEFIKRDWWKDDPILRDHLIMRMANHTTFAVEGAHLNRLTHMWSRIASDWTRDEALAGLFAYVETYGRPLSKLPGSPVATAAITIGRPISGVYNKVLNFRSLDPRDTRAGLGGAGAADRAIWAEFYDPARGLDDARIRQEFARLWSIAGEAEEGWARQTIEGQAEQLAQELTLADLQALWARKARRKSERPRVRVERARQFDRDPVVIALARRRADWRCEIVDCAAPLFLDKQGVRFVEVHHIKTLAEGGDDDPANVACLCPGHHREAHYGKDAAKLAEMLRAVRSAMSAVELPVLT